MGRMRTSTGAGGADREAAAVRREPGERVIALAGNPNVGKSTVFNALTGLHQHTGNWPGKTVGCAQGRCVHRGQRYVLVDLPGTYSLLAHSAEEELARDFLCFGGADGAVVVCDAACLERGLNLALQTMELIPRTVVCVNLMDEAAKRGVRVDLEELSARLGVPVVGTAAGRGEGLEALLDAAAGVLDRPEPPTPRPVDYLAPIQRAVETLAPRLEEYLQGLLPARWAALRLLEGDGPLLDAAAERLGWDLRTAPGVEKALSAALAGLEERGMGRAVLQDRIVAGLVMTAEELCRGVVTAPAAARSAREEKLDRLLTSRSTGIPVMLLLLAGVFWLTIWGANGPSQLLWDALFWLEGRLSEIFLTLGAPDWLHGALVLGAYRTLAWVVSVMLPPMAIFFPLFTLLEDFGYLPRVAFVLDHAFQKARSCGKQALTMAMGFGCNAAGVTGCRIIDSPRERLIATLTNNFVPCNGRFPTLIALITMFFAGAGAGSGLLAAGLLTAVVLLGVGMTFWASRLLSATVLKGEPSAFALELPPYRRPQVGQVVVRSVLDRTLFVLGRSAAVAAPAGLLLWLLANVEAGGGSLLSWCTGFLDPFARLLGLDGVILAAFLLGFPANEIVIPVMLMAYLSTGTLTDYAGLDTLRQLLLDQGWTWLTAACTLVFTLFHWPCSTTCLTIAKETGSVRWTLLAVALPTGIGMGLCFLLASGARLLGLA